MIIANPIFPRRPKPVAAGSHAVAARAGAFTILELLTTVAALVIVLGLMVSLARHVRHRSAEVLTRRVLATLQGIIVHDKDLAAAPVPTLIAAPGPIPAETDLQAAALDNNRYFVQLYRNSSAAEALRTLPVSLYSHGTLRDAWGSPLVFMPSGALNVTIAPQNRPFFFSAGPDRKFATVVDNLYSYERPWDIAAGQSE